MTSTHSQNRAILAYLKQGGALTHKDAERLFACARIAARINDIRAGKADGTQYDKATLISEKVRANGKSVARYRLLTPRLKVIESIPAFKPVEQQSNSLF